MMMIELVTTKCNNRKIIEFADDFSAAGKLKLFLQWWTILTEIGSKFGHFSEPTKSWLIAKCETHAFGKKLLKNTKIKITNSGERYVRSVIDTITFAKIYADETVPKWISEIKFLSQISKIELQAAYDCFWFKTQSYLPYAYTTQHK